jgi:diacylglycerol diphosphate phosphatase/phosphatidate phosphatase
MSIPKPHSYTLNCLGLSSNKISSFSNGALQRGIITYSRLVWSDVLCLICIGLLLAVVDLIPMSQQPYHSSYRVVPMRTLDNGSTFRGPTELSYPYFEPLLSSEACGFVTVGIPILVIALCQVRIRSWRDFHRAVVGSLKAVLFAYVS